MPRATKVSSKRHASAVALPNRSFAVPDAQVQLVPEGTERQQPQTIAVEPIGKKHRSARTLKLPAPLEPTHPYSRSHLKREKRKARQQLAGGGLGSVAAALAEAAGDEFVAPPSVNISGTVNGKGKNVSVPAPAPKPHEDDGKIGAGKSRTLREKTRRAQIATNTKRIPAIMAHPSFKANPWATIRLHASNSLATAESAAAIAAKVKVTPTPVVLGGSKMEGIE